MGMPQGNRVPNATLTLSNQELGITRMFKTDATGAFSFNLLPAATYSLKIDAAGFAELQQNGIVLAVGQSVVLNPSLSVATASEQVVVSPEAPLLTTRTAAPSRALRGAEENEDQPFCRRPPALG